ncbi:amidase (plasmid) [Thioclava sp. 'Guangxiensis']|uniref:amidase n=1 Tax=Thioclava sp. 'Guangxiensis' TaxID=3149044 RepID=UPI0032C4A84F
MSLTIAEVTAALESGAVTAQGLLERVEAALDAAGPEAARIYTALDLEGARRAACASDARRAEAATLGPLDGVPISVKCLFDMRGFVTHSGSKVLENAAPAAADADVIKRLRAAGAVIVGHTNMTEFAYSGLGLNPHFGTPRNPAVAPDLPARIPGGSSSGAAASVGAGLAVIGLGTDTGGSCRIPAAFCGLTGFKPTARRIPQEGCYPLSYTLDSIGSIAADVAGVALADAVLVNEPDLGLSVPESIVGLRFGVLRNYVVDGLEPEVSQAWTDALERLRQAGAELVDLELPPIEAIPALNAGGGITGAEAFAVHRERLAEGEADYDPRVAVRIRKAETMTAEDYAAVLAARAAMIAECDALTEGLDAVLLPTVPMLAPELAPLETDEALYGQTNLRALRNPTVANFLDRCALSLPLPQPDGALPVGLTLMGETMDDRRLLGIGTTVEAVLRHLAPAFSGE